jgi:hypothetical protein
VNLDPEACLEEYGMMILKVRALYKAVMDNRAGEGLPPRRPRDGRLGHARQGALPREGADERRPPRYDLVILDAPATGHGLQMLRVPQVITDVAPPGLLRREADEGLSLLRDPRGAAWWWCTLAEEMPTAETEELMPVLQNELRFPLAKLVINNVLTPVFKTASSPPRPPPRCSPAPPRSSASPARAWPARDEKPLQRKMIERLAKLPGEKVILPALSVERFRRSEIEALARGLGNV